MEIHNPIDRAIEIAGGRGRDLAERLDVHVVLVSQWRNGVRAVPVRHCVEIERLTSHAVTRSDLRPHDYWLIWPDLPAPTTPNDSLGETP